MSPPTTQAVPVTIYAAAAATIIVGVGSCVLNFLLSRWSGKSQEKRVIQGMIEKTIDYSIEYPYFENDQFCSRWRAMDKHQDDQAMRYDNYCCFVFNMIERLWKYAKGDRKEMTDVLHVDELIARHSAWWLAEEENRIGYDQNFRLFVTGVLKEEPVKRYLDRVT